MRQVSQEYLDQFPDPTDMEEMKANPEQEASGDSLLAELEESMPQGVPNDTGQRRRSDDQTIDSEFADLEGLLQESVSAKETEAQYKADKAARAKGFFGMTKEEIEFCNSRMHAFEMARIWSPQFAVGVWWSTECQCCGKKQVTFHRYMEHHVSKVNPSTTRWVTVSSTDMEATPVKEVRQVPTCAKCSEWEINPLEMTELKEIL